MHALYPLVGKYLKGVTSSSLFEARLGYEEMGKEVHAYAPAYVDSEFDELMKYSDHLVLTPSTSGVATRRRFRAPEAYQLRHPRESRVFRNRDSALRSPATTIPDWA